MKLSLAAHSAQPLPGSSNNSAYPTLMRDHVFIYIAYPYIYLLKRAAAKSGIAGFYSSPFRIF